MFASLCCFVVSAASARNTRCGTITNNVLDSQVILCLMHSVAKGLLIGKQLYIICIVYNLFSFSTFILLDIYSFKLL